MKSFMILGSLIGFGIGGGFSLAGGCDWSTAFWRACAAALPAAVLARWWSRIWLSGLNDAIQKRHQNHSGPAVELKPKPRV